LPLGLISGVSVFIIYEAVCGTYFIGGILMNEELKQQLDWMNENLNTIAKNQAEIYMELKEIEGKIEKKAEG
jgi:hypothetical protein